MNIEKLGVRITGVPGMNSIEVKQAAMTSASVHIVLDSDFTFDEIGGHLMPQSYGLNEARELRDALFAAIEAAEQMSDASKSLPS